MALDLFPDVRKMVKNLFVDVTKMVGTGDVTGVINYAPQPDQTEFSAMPANTMTDDTEFSVMPANTMTDDWVKRKGQEHRVKIARAIFQVFDQIAYERGICDGVALAAAFRESINQLQESSGIISCSRLLYIASALEDFDHQSPEPS